MISVPFSTERYRCPYAGFTGWYTYSQLKAIAAHQRRISLIPTYFVS